MITKPEIVEELKRLAALRGGELRPLDVVEAARDETSPLHQQFDWDDSAAAGKWRLHQARNLIRVIVAYEPVGNGKEVPCRVFVSLTPDREGEATGYRLTSAVMADPDMRRQLLADARAEMKRFTAKYKDLDELATVFEAMEAVTVPRELHAASA